MDVRVIFVVRGDEEKSSTTIRATSLELEERRVVKLRLRTNNVME